MGDDFVDCIVDNSHLLDVFQEGGVHTQKLIAVIITAMLALGGVVFLSSDSEAMSLSLTGESDWVEVGESIDFEVTMEDASGVTYVATVYDSNGNTVPGAISSTQHSSSSTLTVTAPRDAGDYRIEVVFSKTVDGNQERIAERALPFKVVEPVILTVTLSNSESSQMSLKVYFVIDDVRIEDSGQEVTIPAEGTANVTYEYLTKDLNHSTTFYLVADTGTLSGNVTGLGPEYSHTFYDHDNNYGLAELIAGIVLVIVAIVAVYIYRKPVKNFGKPKSRR